MDTATKLQTLMEKMKKLETDIAITTAEAEAEKAINSIGADLAGYITKSATTKKVEVKALHGKFFALTVGEDGKLSVALATKANGKPKANVNGNGKGANGNAGEFEYFLKDGRGPFETVQKALEAMAIPEANRPKHNR